MSNPLVAGGAAVVRDFYQKVHAHAASAALVKATLVNSARTSWTRTTTASTTTLSPSRTSTRAGDASTWRRPPTARGSSWTRARASRRAAPTSFTYDVAAGTPLKVTLVWSDYPGTQSATKMLVNNLDLEVSGPGGVFYRGNVFGGGWSATGGLRDNTNNVENVFVQSPAAGAWTVTVRGYNVPAGTAALRSRGRRPALASPSGRALDQRRQRRRGQWRDDERRLQRDPLRREQLHRHRRLRHRRRHRQRGQRLRGAGPAVSPSRPARSPRRSPSS